MNNIIDNLDKSNILGKIKEIPIVLVIEIVIIILFINLFFAILYHWVYINDNKSFMNIYNNNNKFNYLDFFYFSNTTFFSLGYEIVPQSNLSRLISIIQLKLGFIITTVFIARIINVI
jgi:hypothetical protein